MVISMRSNLKFYVIIAHVSIFFFFMDIQAARAKSDIKKPKSSTQQAKKPLKKSIKRPSKKAPKKKSSK